MPRIHIATYALAAATLSCAATRMITQAFAPPSDGLSSSVNDAPKEQYPPDAFPLPPPEPLAAQPRAADGSYLLGPGLYEMDVASFCLHAGTESGGKGEAYLPVPFKGPKADLVTAIIGRVDSPAARAANVTQQEAQALVWAVLSRTKLSEASPSVQATAKVLLATEEIKRADGDSMKVLGAEVLARIKVPDPIKKVLEAENNLRAKFASPTASYAELEAIAAPKAADPGPAKGTWTRLPEGHLIRYFPNSYQSVKMQILVQPKLGAGLARHGRSTSPFLFAADAAPSGCSDGDVKSVPPPQSQIAAPKNSAAQRLGLTGKDLDESKAALQAAKTPDEAEQVLKGLADKCESTVNGNHGYSAANKPPTSECTALGTEKHACMETMIKNSGHDRLKSEVAYGPKPDDQSEASSQVISDDVLAGARAKANCAFKAAKTSGKPTKGVWFNEFRSAGGNYSLRADAVMLKEGAKDASPGNVESVFDFKFNCAALTDSQLASKYKKQITKYQDKFGVTYGKTLKFIHSSVYAP